MDLRRVLLSFSGLVYGVLGSSEHFKTLHLDNKSCWSGSLFTTHDVSAVQCAFLCKEHGPDCKGVSINGTGGQCHGCGTNSFQALENSSIYKRVSNCIDETSPDDPNTVAAIPVITNVLICPTVVATVDNGGIGTWHSPEFCPVGTYAIGFKLRQHASLGNTGDDTATNSVELACSSPDRSVTGGTIISQDGPLGDWLAYVYCDPGYVLKTHQIRVETTHPSDNGGLSNMLFKCGDFSSNANMAILSIDVSNSWGNWGSWSETCGPGQGVCGLRVRIHEATDGGDVLGLNDVVTYCC